MPGLQLITHFKASYGIVFIRNYSSFLESDYWSKMTFLLKGPVPKTGRLCFHRHNLIMFSKIDCHSKRLGFAHLL